MDFAPATARRSPPESIVPMINVVFLLLIFFLMSAQITAQPPEAITPPGSAAEARPEARGMAYLAADGTFHHDGLTGAAALGALRAAAPDALRLTADRGAEAQRLAALLAALRGAGIARVELVTRGR